MSLDTSSVPELSGQQRRCHLLLMLYAPTRKVQLETISQLNRVDLPTTRQDIAEVASEIQRFHHLDLTITPANQCHIEGTTLNQRLCLLHWLRRGLRISPDFVEQTLSVWLQEALTPLQYGELLGDQPALLSLINDCEAMLQRSFSERDKRFLLIFLQYCLWQHHCQQHPRFAPHQQHWLQQKSEHQAARHLTLALKKHFGVTLNSPEQNFLTLMFTLIKTHSYDSSNSQEDLRLMNEIEQLVARFQDLSGMTFSSKEGIVGQLFAHLAPAIERCHFNIGIDNLLLEEVVRMYPRLVRTTHEALSDFEIAYGITLSQEETGLVAICFGAWLMQGNSLQEKQVLLLTHNDSALEQAVEQQVREATLLPLNIKYQRLDEFERDGPEAGIELIVTPYPVKNAQSHLSVIHIALPLQKAQRKEIRVMLEKTDQSINTPEAEPGDARK